MSDAAASAVDSLPGESPAQTKARLRRERLAAKSGAARLQKITALQGGPPKDISEFEKDLPVVQPLAAALLFALWFILLVDPTKSNAPTADCSTVKQNATPSQLTPAASGTATPDPDEIDISQHHYTPASQPRVPSPFAFDGDRGPAFAPGQTPDPSQDPMMAMLQQMMGAGGGGMPGMPGGQPQPGAGPGDFPPGIANLFGAMNGGAAPEPSPEQSSAWIWRLVHSIFSLSLAVYIVLQTPFTGSKLLRNRVTEDDDWTTQSEPTQTLAHFFYLFATFEVVLQSSRYFIEKGQLQGSGILSTIAGILPPPYSGYIRTIGRYSVIYSTVVSDAMVIVFILGASSWWRGAAIA